MIFIFKTIVFLVLTYLYENFDLIVEFWWHESDGLPEAIREPAPRWQSGSTVCWFWMIATFHFK